MEEKDSYTNRHTQEDRDEQSEQTDRQMDGRQDRAGQGREGERGRGRNGKLYARPKGSLPAGECAIRGTKTCRALVLADKAPPTRKKFKIVRCS